MVDVVPPAVIVLAAVVKARWLATSGSMCADMLAAVRAPLVPWRVQSPDLVSRYLNSELLVPLAIWMVVMTLHVVVLALLQNWPPVEFVANVTVMFPPRVVGLLSWSWRVTVIEEGETSPAVCVIDVGENTSLVAAAALMLNAEDVAGSHVVLGFVGHPAVDEATRV
jgi:hypothetical protein